MDVPKVSPRLSFGALPPDLRLENEALFVVPAAS
jgi:hypothetical protein